jgi:hypothetical protein
VWAPSNNRVRNPLVDPLCVNKVEAVCEVLGSVVVCILVLTIPVDEVCNKKASASCSLLSEILSCQVVSVLSRKLCVWEIGVYTLLRF